MRSLLCLDACRVVNRLWAVGAIFGAAAGFDRQQRGQLDVGRVEMLAVHLLGTKEQLGEGQLEQRLDIGYGPAGVGVGGLVFAGDLKCVFMRLRGGMGAAFVLCVVLATVRMIAARVLGGCRGNRGRRSVHKRVQKQ